MYKTPFGDIAAFGTPLHTAQPATAPTPTAPVASTASAQLSALPSSVPGSGGKPDGAAVASKKASVDQVAMMKQAVLGSEEDARQVATARIQDNLLGNEEFVQDLYGASNYELSEKYGQDIADQRYVFAQRHRELLELKRATRDAGQVWNDAAIDTGLMAANTVGGAAALGAAGIDAAFGTTASPHISAGLNWLNEKGNEYRSDLAQARRIQHAVEGSLDKADSEVYYEQDLANAETGWDKGIAQLTKYGRDFKDAIANYGDDPIMMGALVPEGVGSLIPATGAIRVVAKARALKKAMALGKTREEAQAFLKTAQGRKLVEAEAVKSAPAIMGITEAGGAVTQTQQEILSMSEQELVDSPEYSRLRRSGQSHEAAQMEMARDAGIVAGLVSAPGALVAGKIAAPFAANPIKAGARSGRVGSSVAGSVRNVVSEGIEETLQEANAQLASNIGQRSTGLDVALDEGVAAAGAEGLLGGLATAGPLQAPAAVGGTLREGAVAAINGREAQQERKRDKESATNLDKQVDSAEAAIRAGEDILKVLDPEAYEAQQAQLAEQVQQTQAGTNDAGDTVETPNVSEITGSKDPKVQAATDAIDQALYMPEEDAASMAEVFEDVAKAKEASTNGKVQRSIAVQSMLKALSDKDLDPTSRVFMSVELLASLNDMRRADSDDVRQAVENLPEDSPARSNLQVLVDQANTLESSKITEAAKEIISKLEPAVVEQMVAGQDAETTARILSTVGMVNTIAATPEQYDQALNQIRNTKGDKVDRKMARRRERLINSLKLAKKIATDFTSAIKTKEALAAEEDKLFEGKKQPKASKRPTYDMVRNQIEVEGNKDNTMPSLVEHNARISQAVAAGQIQEAHGFMEILRNFGQSQINKYQALETSGLDPEHKKQPYKAYGPFGFFDVPEKNGVFFNPKMPGSVILRKAVSVDAGSVANLYNALLEAHGEELAKVADTRALKPLEFESADISADAKVTKKADTQVDTQAKKTQADNSKVVEEESKNKPEEDTKNPGKEPDTKLSANTVPAESVAENIAESTSEPTSEDAEDVATKPTAEWLTSLRGKLVAAKDKTNHFLEAFVPNKRGTSLVTHESPAKYLSENINNLRTEDNDLTRQLTGDQRKVLKVIVDELVPNLKESFHVAANKAMKTPKITTDRKTGKKKNYGSYQDRLNKKGEDVFGFAELTTMNLAQVNDKGEYVFDDRILDAAVFASIQWMLNDNVTTRPYTDNEDILKAMVSSRDGYVTKEMRQAFQSGTHQQQVVNEIERNMLSLLGLQANKDAPIAFTQGIFKGVAINMLKLMEEHNLVKLPSPLLKEPKSMQQFRWTTVVPNREGKGHKALVYPFRTMPDVFTRIFTKDSEKVRYIGDPPSSEDRAKNQIRNRFARLTRDQVKVIERLENTPFYLNQWLLSFMDSLGSNNLLELLGYTEIDPEDEKRYNQDDLESIKGKNNSLKYGLNSIHDYRTAMEEHASETKTDLASVPAFFKWAISSVGRLQQMGPGTPQGDKIMRETLSATKSTLNLKKEDHINAFWLAVAQAADEIKIEAVPLSKAVQHAQSLFAEDGALAEAASIVNDWLDAVDDNKNASMTQDQQAEFVAAMRASGLGMSAKLLHATVDAVKAQRALHGVSGDPTKFDTFLSLEADGKTDGPINAIIHLSTGKFTPRQIKAMQKGGLFFSNEPMSLNEFIAQGGEAGKDLYNTAAELFEKELAKSIKGAADGSLRYAALKLLDGFLDDFSFEVDKGTAKITAGRKVVKNPLTVFLYGSSNGGIANKVVHAMQGNLNKILTEIQQGVLDGDYSSWKDHPKFNPELGGDPTLVRHLEVLLNTQWDMKKKKPKGKSEYPTNVVKDILSQPQKPKISGYNLSNLQNGLEVIFVDPMAKAIDQTTDGLQKNMKILQASAQVMNEVFKYIYSKRLSGHKKPYRELTQREIDEAFGDASRVAPIIETDSQSFHISHSEKNEDTRTNIASSFGGNLQTLASISQPGEVSVKASPYLTIGIGDGMMIQNAYLNGDKSLDPSLPVFDGIEQALHLIAQASEQINKAAVDGWLEQDIYGPVADALEASLAHIEDFTSLPEEAHEQLRRSLYPVFGEDVAEASPGQLIQGMRIQMRKMANESKARKDTLKELALSGDHMAGAQSPHTRAGIPLPSGSEHGPMNRIYKKHLDRTDKATNIKKARPVVEKPDPKIEALIQKIGTKVEGTEAYAVPGSLIGKLISDRKAFGLFKHVLNQNNALKDATYFFGSTEDLTQIKSGYEHLDDTPIELGQAFAGSRLVFIPNASTETILHETLHLHTGRQLIDYYDAPESLPQEQRAVVKRLESLKDEFLKLDPWSEPKNIREAMETLRTALAATEDNPAAHLGEFISWTLSNQNLSQLAGKQKARSRLSKIVGAALQALKSLLGVKSSPGQTILSNVRFNTEALGLFNPLDIVTEAQQETEAAMNQIFGSNRNLEELEQKFIHKLQRYTEANQTKAKSDYEKSRQALKTAEARERANDAVNHMQRHGFPMNYRQQKAFEAVHMAMMSGMTLDPSIMQRLNRLYQHTLKSLSYEDFLQNKEQPDNADVAQARNRYSALTTSSGDLSKGKRSDLLASFLALSLVSEDMKPVLEELEAPKDIKRKLDTTGSKFDQLLRNIAQSVMNLLTRASLVKSYRQLNNARNVSDQLEVLSNALAEVQGDRRMFAMFSKFSLLDPANEYVADKIEKTTQATVDSLAKFRGKLQSDHARGAVAIVESLVAFGSKDTAASAQEFLTHGLNQTNGFATVRELLAEFRGMTSSNADLFRLINPVKAMIDSLRQSYREKLPEHLASHFNRTLTKDEWSKLYTGIGRTDLMHLDRKEARQLLANPNMVRGMIQKEEARLKSLADPKYIQTYQTKADALARYMMTWEVTSTNLLPNATAIAHLFNEDGPKAESVSKDLIDSIDRLVTLKAVELLDDPTKKALQELIKREPEGIRMLTGYHATVRETEKVRAKSNIEIYNGWKGYVPEQAQDGITVIVADDKDHRALVKRGYTRIGKYTGSREENYRGTRSYYQSSVPSLNSFRQGVAQTVHETYQGVNSRTGQTNHARTSGMILREDAKRVQKRLGAPRERLAPSEYLLPIFDEKGSLAGYERALKPEMLSGMNHDNHLGRVLGAWTGRILEEAESKKFNRELIETLKQIHDQQKQSKSSEFVNIADPDIEDPVIKDAWDVLGRQIKEDAAEIFGKPNYLPVRRDMINDAIGYRSAGFTDPWTGITRFSDETQKKIRETAEFIMGDKAFKYLSKTQDVIGDVVSYAKTTIVVRSVVVSVGNILSNILHLSMHGVNPLTAAVGLKDKFVEITAYVKNREEIQKLEADLAAEERRPAVANKIKAQIKALQDANDALSIKPLIDAGEFSTISESLTEADVAIREGRFSEYIEKATDKLPGWASTVGKNVLVTKDTALFQGLNRMVQYGDFVAKAVLYDHLQSKKKMSHQEIMDVVAEEYVNYNRLPGRGRDFLESMGLIWFFNYKIRIMKIVAKMIRENPLNSLLYSTGSNVLGDIDTVFDGSLAGTVMDGSVGYAVGPGMGIPPWQLNPWWNLTH